LPSTTLSGRSSTPNTPSTKLEWYSSTVQYTADTTANVTAKPR